MRPTPTLLTALLLALLAGACSQDPATRQEPAGPSVQEAQPSAMTPGAKATQQFETTLDKVEQGAARDAKTVAREADKVIDAGKAVVEESVDKAKQEVSAAAAVVTGSLPPPSAPAPRTPEVVTYPASIGKVDFTHAIHAARLDCGKCHTTDPPQKIAIDKEIAHALCRGCHEVSGGKAPTACTGCHRKG